jgi:hypothetical protein
MFIPSSLTSQSIYLASFAHSFEIIGYYRFQDAMTDEYGTLFIIFINKCTYV